MADIEVVLEPNFQSDNCYAILGCRSSASREKVRRAYRDLSRKYHPDRHPNNEQLWDIFRKIGTAYATLCETEDKKTGAAKYEDYRMTLDESKAAYQREFGKYRGQYYSRGAIFGLPYSYRLKESLERKKCCREGLSLSVYCIQFSFFRSWFIKKNLNGLLLFTETICTWAAVTLAVINFLLQEMPQAWDEIVNFFGSKLDIDISGLDEIPHVGVIGGVNLLIASFIMHFWYGFTRYPLITNKSFTTWLKTGKTFQGGGEMFDIQSVCSLYFHSDTYQRSQTCIILTCLPIIIVEHICSILSSIPVVLYYLFRYCQIVDSAEAAVAFQFAKSFGALLSIIGYYLLWILGGSYFKVIAAAILIINQRFYTAILFRKSFWTFLQSFIFGEVFVVTMKRKPQEVKIDKDTAPHGRPDIDIEQGIEPPGYDATSGQTVSDSSLTNEIISNSNNNQEGETEIATGVFDFNFCQEIQPNIQEANANNEYKYSYNNSTTGDATVNHRGERVQGENKQPASWWSQERAGRQDLEQPEIKRTNTEGSGGGIMWLFSNNQNNNEEKKSDDDVQKFDVGSVTTRPPKHKKDENNGDQDQTVDAISMYRSVKRRIEAEFYARVYGTEPPADDRDTEEADYSSVSAVRKRRNKRVRDFDIGDHSLGVIEEGRSQELHADPPISEIQMDGPSNVAMFDECSSNSSVGYESFSDRGIGVKALQTSLRESEATKQEPVTRNRSLPPRPTRVSKDDPPLPPSESIKELDDVLGEYIPAVTRISSNSRSRSSPLKSMSSDSSQRYSARSSGSNRTPDPPASKITVTTRDNTSPMYRRVLQTDRKRHTVPDLVDLPSNSSDALSVYTEVSATWPLAI